MKTVKMAIIGCGGLGNFHLDNVLKMEGVEVVALVDVAAAAVEQTARKVPGARTYTDYKDLFAEEKGLDAALVVITPNGHGDLEFLAAEAGVHLYVEKPIELDLEVAKKKAEAIKKAGIITSVGYQERYQSEVGKLKELLKNQRVGLIEGSWLGHMPGGMWWRQKAGSGGQMVEQSTHVVDMMRYLIGDIKAVYSRGFTGLNTEYPGYDIEDTSISMFSFDSGLEGVLKTGCFIKHGTPGDVGLRIFCEGVMVEFKWNAEITYRTYTETRTVTANEPAHFNAVAAFIEAVRTGDKSGIRSDYEDGLRTLAVTLAASQSMESGERVLL